MLMNTIINYNGIKILILTVISISIISCISKTPIVYKLEIYNNYFEKITEVAVNDEIMHYNLKPKESFNIISNYELINIKLYTESGLIISSELKLKKTKVRVFLNKDGHLSTTPHH